MNRQTLILSAAVLAFAAFGLRSEDSALLTLAGLGDCEKITKDGAIPPSPHFWDATAKKLRLHGGRNEMVAAQLMLAAKQDLKNVNVEIGDLKGPQVIPANPNIQLYQEMYQYVSEGKWFNSLGNGWVWDKTQAFPDQKWYPEILAPFNDPFGPEHKPVGAPFDIKIANGPNQGVWIDIYIPRDAAPGVYTTPLKITVGKKVEASATLELTVHPFTIPDDTHVDGYGEFYGKCYAYHKAAYKEVGFDTWWPIASRYHQMAHQHRFEISDREPYGPKFFLQTDLYDKAYGSILDGTLFTKENGYIGPGANTGVNFWRAPFPEITGRVDEKTNKFRDWNASELQTYTEQAKVFWEHCVQKKWDKKRFFAYPLDEVANTPEFVKNQRILAEALDAGAGKGHIDLMWTSHTNPRTLAADPATDLRGAIRWWSPNAAGCDPGFLQERMKQGETAWFYHHAPPAIGLHVVNASGIDLRTWGAVCWRYKVGGSYWWGMDFHDADQIGQDVLTKAAKNRWGNGTLFYPGARLPDLGMPAIDGPLSCLRMKAYRRGLLDYEYGWLLKQKGKEQLADAIVKKVIPVALAEAMPAAISESEGTASKRADDGKAADAKPTTKIATAPWSTDINVWYQMREDLAAELVK